jgi:hypothetical protein
MAETKKHVFSSIIDEILDDRSPKWEELDLEGAAASGEEWNKRTDKYVDEDFIEEISESATSHNTPVWGPHNANAPAREVANRQQRLEIARAAAQEKRQAKEAHENSGIDGPTTTSRMAAHDRDFVNEIADNASVQLEKLMSPNKARNTAEDIYQKPVTDAATLRYITKLLEQGHAPSKIARVLMYLAAGPKEAKIPDWKCKDCSHTNSQRCESCRWCGKQRSEDKPEGQIGPSIPSGSDAAHRHTLGSEDSKGGWTKGYHKFTPNKEEKCTECGAPYSARQHEQHEASTKTAGPIDVEAPEAAFAGGKLRPFTKEDWYGLAGAERFPDGTEPLIGEVAVINWPELEEFGPEKGQSLSKATLIVDARGVSLMGIEGEYSKDIQDKNQAVAAANQLLQQTPVDVSQLATKDWEEINLSESAQPTQMKMPQEARKPMNASKKGRRIKTAENQPLFNRQMSQEYLNQMSGLLGFNNLEPNHFMPKQPESYERLKTKVGEWAGELRSSLNRMTAGVPKAHKEAALIRIVQREIERKQATKLRGKTAGEQTGGQLVRAEQTLPSSEFRQSSIAAVQDKYNRKTSAKEQQVSFNASTVEALHKKGHTIEKIYNAAARKIGSVQAGDAVKQFIAGLKKNSTKIALSQIDCRFLKQKLGVQNAIVGASKCATCVFRQGMHCGLTGGTLLSFPGMERQASNHKIADGAPKDGHAMLAEFDMEGEYPINAGDIDIKESSGQMDVEMGSSFSMGTI